MNDREKPELRNGVPLASISDQGKLLGMVDGEEVLVVRRGGEVFAVGAFSVKRIAGQNHELSKTDLRQH